MVTAHRYRSVIEELAKQNRVTLRSDGDFDVVIPGVIDPLSYIWLRESFEKIREIASNIDSFVLIQARCTLESSAANDDDWTFGWADEPFDRADADEDTDDNGCHILCVKLDEGLLVRSFNPNGSLRDAPFVKYGKGLFLS